MVCAMPAHKKLTFLGQVAAVFDVLGLLAVTLRLFQLFDDQACGVGLDIHFCSLARHLPEALHQIGKVW